MGQTAYDISFKIECVIAFPFKSGLKIYVNHFAC